MKMNVGIIEHGKTTTSSKLLFCWNYSPVIDFGNSCFYPLVVPVMAFVLAIHIMADFKQVWPTIRITLNSVPS